MRRRLGWFWAVVIACWGHQALAQTVAVFWRSNGDDRAPETASRLRGELLAMGLKVTVHRGQTDLDASGEDHRALLPSAAPRDVDAWMTVTSDDGALVVAVWVASDNRDFTPLVTLAESLDSKNAPEQLAIRAAEALHSTFVERDIGADSSSRRAVALPSETVGVPKVYQSELNVPRNFRLAVGGAALVPTEGLTAAFMPLVRFDWSVTPLLSVQATLAGFGSRSTATTPQGSASVSLHYGVLGANYHLPRLLAFEPFVGTSLGALLSSIEGSAESPFTAHDIQHAAWLMELSVGTHVELSQRHYLTFTGHAQFARPSLDVRVVEQVVGISGRPNWVASVATGVRL
jgi:hypothetical protein